MKPSPIGPRHAPDPPARRALEKLLATAAGDPRLMRWGYDGIMEALAAYCARAYQLGRDRGRRELLRQMGGKP
jgi:hypothetical protein